MDCSFFQIVITFDYLFHEFFSFFSYILFHALFFLLFLVFFYCEKTPVIIILLFVNGSRNGVPNIVKPVPINLLKLVFAFLGITSNQKLYQLPTVFLLVIRKIRVFIKYIALLLTLSFWGLPLLFNNSQLFLVNLH